MPAFVGLTLWNTGDRARPVGGGWTAVHLSCAIWWLFATCGYRALEMWRVSLRNQLQFYFILINYNLNSHRGQCPGQRHSTLSRDSQSSSWVRPQGHRTQLYRMQAPSR